MRSTSSQGLLDVLSYLESRNIHGRQLWLLKDQLTSRILDEQPTQLDARTRTVFLLFSDVSTESCGSLDYLAKYALTPALIRT